MNLKFEKSLYTQIIFERLKCPFLFSSILEICLDNVFLFLRLEDLGFG